jgi:Ca2+-binding RTX toxin-like protein
MIHKLTPELIALLTHWATRPDASTDLRNIFGVESHQSESLLQSIRAGDFSWIPKIQILPAASIEIAYGAYARETGAIYLSEDCPSDLVTTVLLEEIGHHIDALFNEQETPGDEGALFSAVVRGISLSDEEITALLNEDDSAVLFLNEQQVAVECASSRGGSPAQTPRGPTPTPRGPLNPIITVVPRSAAPVLAKSGFQDSITSAVSYDHSTSSPAAHGLTLSGGGNLVGYGNSQVYNYLDARQNTGNSTLIAGPANLASKGPSSSTLWGGSGDNVLIGRSGLRTQISNANASRGSTKIVLASTVGFSVGQYLGGVGIATGTRITKISGTTLSLSKATAAAITGGSIYSLPVAASTTTTGAAVKGSSKLLVTSASQFYVGQILTGTGIASGTTVQSVSGNTLILSTKITATIGKNATIQGFDSYTPPPRFVHNTDLFVGGAGNSTIYAGDVSSTLQGGAKNNLLIADQSTGRTLGQSLWGGNNNGSSLYGNTLRGGSGKDTLRSGTGYNTLISGSKSVAQSNTLLGGGISNSLVAGLGNDSLTALSGSSTLRGGTGKTTLLSGTGTNSLLSGSAAGLPGNGNLLNANLGTSNTLVAGLGRDTLIGGDKQNLLLVNQANLAAFANNSITLSTLASASNTLGISPTSPITINDSLLGTMSVDGVTNLGTVANLGIASSKIILGTNAEKVGVHTLVAGLGSDTLSAAEFTTNSVLLDAFKSLNRVSLVGGTGNDTFLGSKGGYDTMTGGAGEDSFVIQASALAGSSFGRINGNDGTDTLRLNAAASLSGTNFNGVSNIEVLHLESGNNLVGSLQGSGIKRIVGNTGSDTLSANVYGAVRSAARAGSNTITLNASPGTTDTTGFAIGQIVSGNGIALGTTISNISSTPALGATPGTVTLTLSTPTTSLISQGGAILGWIDGATLDGGINTTSIATSSVSIKTVFQADTGALVLWVDPNSVPANANGAYSVADALPIGSTLTGNGIQNGTTVTNVNGPWVTLSQPVTLSISANTTLQVSLRLSDARGDYLVGYGANEYLYGARNSGSQLVSNTLVSGTSTFNTLIGGAGANLYLINNLPGAAALPTIGDKLNPLLIQSGSTIQFTGNGVRLDDMALSSVSAKAAQKIVTANGNNLITIGLNAAQIGIQTIIGGVGSDTFVTGLQEGQPVPISLIVDALAGATTIFVNDTTELSIGSLVRGTGIAELTSIQGIDPLTGALILNKGITEDLPVDFALSGIPMTNYTPSVYFDASRGSGNQSLASGSGNDTLLAGTGNASLDGGNGNNSLRGGAGNNLILSGVGNSILDSGFGISTLQADGGVNRFIVRNRFTRILNPYSLERDPISGQIALPDPAPIATTPEIGIVDTYVNFDPILGSPVSQFDPGTPDNSPSITKSPSFASSDISSFYNLKYFNLLGPANYGVGNALDNTISAATTNALILGMGGNNTIVASGAGSSLYGNSSANYSSPDLYAYAPTDTRTQAFVDGVMGVAGNNSLVATGASSYLDGGSGYDDGLFNGSGANTLIGTGGNDTVIISHQADLVSLTGSSNTIITSVDLYQIPDNVSDLILNVTPQLANSGQVSFDGQRMTAGYAAVGGAMGGYTNKNSLTAGSAPEIVVNNSAVLQVAYGISDGTIYGSENVDDANLSLTVGSLAPDPQNPGKKSVSLSWTTPLTPEGDPVAQTMGYLINYQMVASTPLTMNADAAAGSKMITVANIAGIYVGQSISGNGIQDGTTIVEIDSIDKILTLSNELTSDIPAAETVTGYVSTPYLTYLSGTSQDLTGTSTNPSLLVENLSTSFTDPYTEITYDSSNSNISYNFKVTAKETVLPAYTDELGNLIAKPVTLIGGAGNDVIYGGLLNTIGSTTSNTRPVLTNNPINPLDPGVIPSPAPWDPTATYSSLFPTYLSGGQSGEDLLISSYINDGSGNDFTAYEYINGVPKGVNFSGLNTLEGGQGSDTFIVINGGRDLNVLNGVVQTSAYDNVIKYGSETPVGQHNLIISRVDNLSLSDTIVNQGKFIDQAWAADGGQYIGGNRLDNTLVAYGSGSTLLGAGGRDYLDGRNTTTGNTLIGGTAYGLDSMSSISGALADYAKNQTASIYRDTDPVPVQPNGPGAADNSQYWMINGGYDPLRNSDTLLASNSGDLIDGGAGNDSMVGGEGNDTLHVSNGSNSNAQAISGSDIVKGGGGNDWIILTGSDTYWSGLTGATTAQLGYTLSNNGDADDEQSISNIKLQDGSPVARFATGNATSTGMNRLTNGELGSNQLIGNEQDNTLNGGGVGGVSQVGIGIDTLTGGGGADLFVIQGQYTSSDYSSGNTDRDYAIITDFSAVDNLQTGNAASGYLIGPTPSEALFSNNVLRDGIAPTTTSFGIYTSSRDLVAVINTTDGFALRPENLTNPVGGTNYLYNVVGTEFENKMI